MLEKIWEWILNHKILSIISSILIIIFFFVVLTGQFLSAIDIISNFFEKKFMSDETTSNNFVVPSDSTFSVIILPFNDFRYDTLKAQKIEKALEGRLNDIMNQESLEISVLKF